MTNVHSFPAISRSKGFTLIEVMVGVAIFAVLAGLIVGSIQSNVDRNAKLEAQRFIAVVNEVRDEALISGKTLILKLDEEAAVYSFEVFGARDSQSEGDSGSNESNAEDLLLRSRRLHKSVEVKWDLLDEIVDEDNEFDTGEGESIDIVEERAFITALGEITPFEVRFRGEEVDFVVALNDDGVLNLDTRPSNFY